MNTKLFSFLMFSFLTIQFLFAQKSIVVKNPPIIIEPMVSDRGFYIQALINKKFQSIPKLGFFSASGILSEWNKNEAYEVMMQSYLTYEVSKRFTINTGFHYSQVTGVRPTAGVMYTYANPTWLIVVFPRIDLISESDMETFSVLEFKPKINKHLSFYSRIQGTYIYSFNSNSHQRSYIYVRTGIVYKEFTFGGGYNIDYYSPEKLNINSLGAFLNFQLF